LRNLKKLSCAALICAVATLVLGRCAVSQAPDTDGHAQPPRSGGEKAGAQVAPAAGGATITSADADHACASCHAAQVRTQPFTPMGKALQLPQTNPILKAHPLMTLKRGGYTYTVQTAGENSTYAVTDGVQTMTLPIKWSMGVGAQTWVLEYDGKFYESLVSYYPAIDGLDITTGDEQLKPTTLLDAMGRFQSKEDNNACFGCHASNALVKGTLNLSTVQPGLTCEHCHDGALLHAADAEQGAFDTAPPKLSALSTEHISDFCGKCHRTWEMVVRNKWRGPINVRFQAYRLANSRCYDGTDPRISCIACHNPHENVVRTSTSYDSKCLACHAPAIAVPSTPSQPATLKSVALTHERGKVCPVAKSDCVSCHMPKVVFPGGGGHLTFIDHDIRIVKPGDAYPD
jgi:hypothetical protein